MSAHFDEEINDLYERYNFEKEKVLFSPEMLSILESYVNKQEYTSFKDDLMQELLMETSKRLDNFNENFSFKSFPKYLSFFLSHRCDAVAYSLKTGASTTAVRNHKRTLQKYEENVKKLKQRSSLDRKINDEDDTTVLDLMSDCDSFIKRRKTELVKIISSDFPTEDKEIFEEKFIEGYDEKEISKNKGISVYLVKKALERCIFKIQSSEDLMYYAMELQKTINLKL